MLAIRLLALALLVSLASGQDLSTPQIGRSDTPVPGLPVVDDRACPGKDNTVPNVKVSQQSQLHSSWKDDAKPIGTLTAGEKVTVLGGINVVREPDKAIIKYIGPDLPSLLKVGERALAYGIEADGDIVFWAEGVWFKEWIEAAAETGHCGFTSGFSLGGCTIDIIKDGSSEWWVQVKTSSGLTGWVLATKFNGDKRWYGNFSRLCKYGED
jgi:hypothetical protein